MLRSRILANRLAALTTTGVISAPAAVTFAAGTISQEGTVRFRSAQGAAHASRDLAFGTGFAIGIDADGSVFGWGENQSGQGSIPDGIGPAVRVATSSTAVALVRQDGSLRAWGTISTGSAITPVPLPPGDPLCSSIVAGANHFLAIRTDGSPVAFGAGNAGQCAVPADVPIVTAMAGGATHSLALRPDGSVTAWGTSSAGATAVPSTLGPCARIASGASHALAIRADGGVTAWGSNTGGQCTVPSDLGPCVDVAGGARFSAAIRADGSVRTWGQGSHEGVSTYVAFPDGATLGTCTRLHAGEQGLAARRVDGTFGCIGMDMVGQGPAIDALPTDVTAAASSHYFTTLVRSDGSVTTVGCTFLTNSFSSYGPITLPGDLGTCSGAAGGFYHALLLRTDGTVRGIGSNRAGQISIPSDLANVVQVAASIDTSYARMADGSVRSWGAANTSAAVMTPPADLAASAWITAYYNRAGSVSASGAVRIWGAYGGSSAVPAALPACSSAAVGASHTIALQLNGMPRAWNTSGQTSPTAPETGVPSDVGPCTQVAAGGRHNVVLQTDGTVRSWGQFHSGSLVASSLGSAVTPTFAGRARFVWAGPESSGVAATETCPGDLDGNGSTEFGDLAMVLLEFGPCAGCAADVDGNGMVDFGDVAMLMLSFGDCG